MFNHCAQFFKKNSNFNHLFCLIIISGTLNLFKKYNYAGSYVSGWKIDYLLPKFYLSDLFILLFIILFFINFFQKKFFQQNSNSSISLSFQKKIKDKKFLLSITLLITCICIFIWRQSQTLVPLAAFWQLGKIAEFSLFSYCLFQVRDQLDIKQICKTLLLLAFFQSLIGLYQFIFQKQLLPYLFLGETNIALFRNLSRVDLSPLLPEKVMPYGTFSHPNILAGFIVISILINVFYHLFQNTNQISSQKFSHIKNKFTAKVFLQTILLIPIIICLFLTQSWSAFSTLFLGMFIYYIVKYIFKNKSIKKNYLDLFIKNNFYFFYFTTAIFLVIFQLFLAPFTIFQLAKTYPLSNSITRRAELQQAAQTQFSTHPILGSGLNQFIPQLPQSAISSAIFHQPVHNTLWLTLTEIGLLGVIIPFLTYSLFPQKPNNNSNKKRQLLFLLTIIILTPILVLDHYLISSQIGIIILITITSIYLNRNML